MAGFGWSGMSGVVSPGLGCAPGTDSGKVDAEGTGGAVCRQDGGQSVAQLWQGGSQSVEAGGGGHSGEVQSVAGGVKVALEGCGIFSAE